MLNDSDSSFVAMRMQEAITAIEHEWTRPSVVFKPKVYLDGDKWCALLGENIMEGVCGFGDSPGKAMQEFDREWYRQ